MEAAPLIINLCPTGMVPTRQDSPHVPLTPEEIGADVARCRAAGASIVHLHARDAQGLPTHRIGAFRDIVAEVRARCPDIVVCVTTSGRRVKSLEDRAEVLGLDGDLKPDMASLTLGSMNFPKEASVNAPDTIRGLAEQMQARGIVPELELFDQGMVDYAKYLIAHGVLRPPLYANLLLGSLGTLSATPLHLAQMVNELPAGTTWAGAGIGRFQLGVNSLAIAMGGHVRVGLEDNLWWDARKERLATNAMLVERVAGIARAMGREIASPDEARRIIGLPARAGAAGVPQEVPWPASP
ncbi:MAG: 3-keto-5-aminohexanoate cleavage protein [Halobacteriales archaeon]|nr:3-keto-5-aminohexanoate cleavage protein [Halobacteriales archaeon]